MATIDYKQLATPEANLIELLSAQNQDGTYTAKLMGSEPFAVLAAKTIYNAYNDIEDNMAADVEGPASSTDNALARFDGTTGKLLQNSNAILTDAGALSLASNLTVSGTGTSAFSGAIKARSGSADEVGVGPYGTGTGGIYFGNGTVSLFNDANTQLKSLVGLSLAGNLTVSGGTISSGTASLTLKSTASTVVLQSAGTTALTLDSSQTATFANHIKLGSGNVIYFDGGITTYIQGSSGALFMGTNGASAISIDSSQNATFAGTVYAGASSNIGWNGRAYLSALADGKVQVTNWANNGTSMLVLGAAASTSYPMLKRNGTGIDVRLADDSAFATFRALDFSAQGAATTVGANQVSYGGTTATTATAGAQTLPANPVGFIIVNVAGTTAKIPYYAN